ncbi:HutD family protein [Marinifilum sp. RC60d5]|uniref:HutD family protein n=1 Tax=Marinifilum sp. RC60d5 TaxID=3458414 RepID=UPI0040371D49
MEYSILTPTIFKTINWAGGTSTQLFIFPENADYKLLNFDFRISTAKVEIEKSEFTPLPGVSRHLMILDGEIEVEHKEHYQKHLKQFDTDTFEGNWHTSSVGKCTDFNLMTRNNNCGEISSLCFNAKDEKKLLIENNLSFFFIYVHNGKFICKINTEELIIHKGNLFCIQQADNMHVSIIAEKPGDIIVTKIKTTTNVNTKVKD